MRRWIPYAVLILALLALWLLLQESVSPGAFLLGAVLAIAGFGALAALRPPKPHLGRISAIPGLLRDVLVEIVRSNIAVARIVLWPGAAQARHSGFVLIPLDMRSPHGLAALACILTATPGTLWVEYDSVESTVLLHVLDLVDEKAWVHTVKTKWERRLMQVFE